ncbi:MAG: hypothetical protein JXR73_00130 [Candidatus Omnitrophica bacterium]|nr:hypothetical protein [Candidatus Omnitrophota bacterium]
MDNIKVKPFEPIIDCDPVALEIDGDFEGGPDAGVSVVVDDLIIFKS